MCSIVCRAVHDVGGATCSRRRSSSGTDASGPSASPASTTSPGTRSPGTRWPGTRSAGPGAADVTTPARPAAAAPARFIAGASGLRPSAGAGCDVGLTGDEFSFGCAGGGGVPGAQHQPARVHVVLEAGQRAVRDLLRPVELEDLFLVEMLEHVPEEQDHDLVRHHQDTFARVV